ncbi:MAG: RNA polymerase sigma factor [Paludibacteraceae bacterium]|nr:RNA polymerase sigma factor [Paludibacteraceae bacterium]MBN2788006.1 RNA polymerase sigma factor [Paludibacteraceae bacterium]
MVDNAFIKKLQKRDKKAFYELFSQYAPEMKYVCYRYLKSMEDAEDAMQEGFIKIFEKIGSFRNEGSFEGWMKRIFINISLKMYEKKVKQNTYMEYNENIGSEKFDKAPESDENSYNIECESSLCTEDKLMSLLAKLPEHYRLVFNMYVVDEMKHKDIAEALNINEMTSKTRLLRARTMLKGQIINLQ